MTISNARPVAVVTSTHSNLPRALGVVGAVLVAIGLFLLIVPFGDVRHALLGPDLLIAGSASLAVAWFALKRFGPGLGALGCALAMLYLRYDLDHGELTRTAAAFTLVGLGMFASGHLFVAGPVRLFAWLSTAVLGMATIALLSANHPDGFPAQIACVVLALQAVVIAAWLAFEGAPSPTDATATTGGRATGA